MESLNQKLGTDLKPIFNYPYAIFAKSNAIELPKKFTDSL